MTLNSAPVTPINLVELTEIPDAVYGLTKKAQERYEARNRAVVLVNPAHVGAVMPRSNYTTVLVQGHYVHVAHTLEETCSLLGIAHDTKRS